MQFRDYNPKNDEAAALRIWREIGWLDREKDQAAVAEFLAAGRALVAEINGEPECMATSMPGELWYQQEDLTFSAITSVTTGRVARKQGLARRLTARLIAADAAAGTQVAGLGIFEQGFYNLLGFGNGSYEHWIGFDPAQLRVKIPDRSPLRLSEEDSEALHRAMLQRQRHHGGIRIFPLAYTQAECRFGGEGFGLGYKNDEGKLTHFLWFQGKGEHGPYQINMTAFENGQQWLELLGVLKSLGDQIRLVRLREPAGVQMQDFLSQPFRYRQLTKNSPYQQNNQATSYWQARVCDVPGCLAKTHLPGETLRFNLQLSDPIRQYLPADSPWQGVAGEYVVTLGPESGAATGHRPGLPTMITSVGTWTRLWLGVLPASSLAAYADLQAPPELLSHLDRLFCLPTPHFGWDF